MNKTKLPESFRQYFWDVDFDGMTLEDAPMMVLKRLLDRGGVEEIGWVKKHYKLNDIKKLLLFTKDLSPKTGKFWADVLGVKYKNVPCLNKPYTPIQWGQFS